LYSYGTRVSKLLGADERLSTVEFVIAEIIA
jgi:hypothetical protein